MSEQDNTTVGAVPLTYIPVEDYGDFGRAFAEVGVDESSRADLIHRILCGDYEPIHVVAFDRVACDVSRAVATEMVQYAWDHDITLTEGARAFAESHGVPVPSIERR